MLRFGFAAGMALIVTAPAAHARTPGAIDIRTPAPARFASTLSDHDLADIHGTGLMQPHLAQVARDEFEGFNRFTAQTMPVSFENWLNDVATPLIVSNLSR